MVVFLDTCAHKPALNRTLAREHAEDMRIAHGSPQKLKIAGAFLGPSPSCFPLGLGWAEVMFCCAYIEDGEATARATESGCLSLETVPSLLAAEGYKLLTQRRTCFFFFFWRWRECRRTPRSCRRIADRFGCHVLHHLPVGPVPQAAKLFANIGAKCTTPCAGSGFENVE